MFMRKGSVYKSKIEDKLAVYFAIEKYGIDNTGKEDVSAKLQQAINDAASEFGYGILYVPEGKYLLSKTIYIPKAVRVIGYGENRPKFILADNATDFDKPQKTDKGGYKYLFWFVDKPVTNDNEVYDANPGTFYSAMSNVDIELGQGNEYAVALRTHYAQHSFVSHMNIDVMSGMAGIYDVGNEMENIHISGGQYAIITTKCSPGWPFMMVDTLFENQKKAAIKTREAGLAMVRNYTRNAPKFIEVDDGFFERIYLEDSVIDNISDCIFDMSMDENALTQINTSNVLVTNCETLAKFADSGRVVKLENEGIINYIHGTVINDQSDDRKIIDKCQCEAVSGGADINEYLDRILKTDIKGLPEVDSWIDVTKHGIVGDGNTDNSDAINELIKKEKILYFPQGEYICTKPIVLEEDTIIIGMHPYGTRLILKDNSEFYTGIGCMEGFIVTKDGAANILNGIGIDSGTRNPRACAVYWKAGSESYVNDVKLIGGHGNLIKGTGEFDNPYNESRTADKLIERMWDNQYPSFYVDGGGGVFKDVWSASTYATAGFEIHNSDVKSRVYCMSLEHHQRCELRVVNSSNWKFYAFQIEEEFAEGEYAVPCEIIDSNRIEFAMAYFFRTIFVKTPMDYCVKCYGSKDIDFYCVNNVSQMKYTIGSFLKNYDNGNEIRLWQMAHARVAGKSDNAIDEKCVIRDEGLVASENANVKKVYEGFRFADGGVTDSKGNFYFVDSLDKRVYMIDATTEKLSILFESPIKINSVGVDLDDNVIYIGEYVIPIDATKDGKLQENILPEDSYGTSYGFWYNNRAMTYAFVYKDSKLQELEKIEIGSIKPENVIYPGNRWRDGSDYKDVICYNPGKSYLAPDNKTIIPCFYDLIRANNLTSAKVGENLYSVDEMYKRVYAGKVDENGLLTEPRIVAEQGDYCTMKAKDSLIVCEDNIKYYNGNSEIQNVLKLSERPITIGLKNDKVKYVTTAHKVFVLE